MPQAIRHPEWRRYHETTKYPFADEATLTNASGLFIPEGLFLDATLYPIGGLPALYLSRVVVTNEVATIVIGDQNNEILARAAVNIIEPPANVVLSDSLGRPAGVLVSEPRRLATLQSWPLGTHEFSLDSTEFVARVCIPTPEVGVRGILLDDGSFFTGDVWIVGDDGVVVSSEQVGEEQHIRVDVVGDPLFRRRLCAAVFHTPNFLKTVTVRHRCDSIVCGPDTGGDFKITVGDQDAPDPILRIRAIPEGLVFEAVGEQLENLG